MALAIHFFSMNVSFSCNWRWRTELLKFPCLEWPWALWSWLFQMWLLAVRFHATVLYVICSTIAFLVTAALLVYWPIFLELTEVRRMSERVFGAVMW